MVAAHTLQPPPPSLSATPAWPESLGAPRHLVCIRASAQRGLRSALAAAAAERPEWLRLWRRAQQLGHVLILPHAPGRLTSAPLTLGAGYGWPERMGLGAQLTLEAAVVATPEARATLRAIESPLAQWVPGWITDEAGEGTFFCADVPAQVSVLPLQSAADGALIALQLRWQSATLPAPQPAPLHLLAPAPEAAITWLSSAGVNIPRVVPAVRTVPYLITGIVEYPTVTAAPLDPIQIICIPQADHVRLELFAPTDTLPILRKLSLTAQIGAASAKLSLNLIVSLF